MTIKVTVNLITAEQFGLNPNVQPDEDRQRILLAVPAKETTTNSVAPAFGGIEVTASEDSQPLSYAVPQLTGGSFR